MIKQLVEETSELCGLCGGIGTRLNFDGSKPMQTVKKEQTCERCQGEKYVVTKRVVRYETVVDQIPTVRMSPPLSTEARSASQGAAEDVVARYNAIEGCFR